MNITKKITALLFVTSALVMSGCATTSQNNSQQAANDTEEITGVITKIDDVPMYSKTAKAYSKGAGMYIGNFGVIPGIIGMVAGDVMVNSDNKKTQEYNATIQKIAGYKIAIIDDASKKPLYAVVPKEDILVVGDRIKAFMRDGIEHVVKINDKTTMDDAKNIKPVATNEPVAH
jgi:hypothetical protein